MERWRLLSTIEINESKLLVPDSTTCHACGVPVGWYISYDPYTDREKNRFTYVGIFPTAPDRLFCDGCLYEADHGDLFLGPIWCNEFSIDIVRQKEGFVASIATYGPDHGMIWERELPPRHTLGGAVSFAKLEIDTITDSWV